MAMPIRDPVPMPPILDQPVQFLKGVGPRRAERLASAGIRTVGDLIEYPPFRYEDRTRFRPIAALQDGEWALVRGRISGIGEFHGQRRALSIFEMLVKDETGTVMLKYFNQPYLRRVFRDGQELVIFGQAKRDPYLNGKLSFANPEHEIIDEEDDGISLHSGRVVPVYRRIGDLTSRSLRQIVHAALERLGSLADDWLPEPLRRRLRLPDRHTALIALHFPQLRATTEEGRSREMDLINAGLSPAHKRFIFEEFFLLQLGIAIVRDSRRKEHKDRRVVLGPEIRDAIKRVLPFHPTEAQKRVLREIVDDMRSQHPMSRLLQGDVGSGKTIVAAQAAIVSVENGNQVAVMAPTEILAEQHYFYFRRLLAPLGYGIDLLKGGQGAKERREILERVATGQTRIVVGTHALIQKGVEFRNLALAIIDEQHRFGVVQRNILREKGQQPDVLVMTATPIPRSLALTLYGDLDVSVIDELPPGRKPVLTVWHRERSRQKIYAQMRGTVEAGHQVYVVCPLVEESEKTDLRAATEMAGHLAGEVFPDLSVGLLHGRMKSAEKEVVMAEFAGGKTHVLVSTTVVEVGVDVSNAALMVIEHAERFGLSQLHQLRGRVGRGSEQSVCLLVGDPANSLEARRRLEIMCETNDGFQIAEVDLELRGPGEIAGTRQSGIPAFKFANLVRDRKALETAREEALQLVNRAGKGGDREAVAVLGRVRRRWQERWGLALIG
jgi:ATP-dependent DNA helicase RecG